MNSPQRLVLIGVMVAILAMLLFPPFYVQDAGGRINMGYALLFRPPTIVGSTGSVDIGMLFTQWVGVLVVGGLATFMLKDRNDSA